MNVKNLDLVKALDNTLILYNLYFHIFLIHHYYTTYYKNFIQSYLLKFI